MSATIFAFPDADDRADREFARTGETDSTRAYEAAIGLYAAAVAPRRDDGFWEKNDSFACSVERLAIARPHEVEDMALMRDGMLVELAIAPSFLAALRRSLEGRMLRSV